MDQKRISDSEYDELERIEGDYASQESVDSSSAVISACVMLSRITGFARTWAMAFALGSSFLSSSYQVANNLPNMLYELVMGGILVTAFLPVYISVKKKSGEEQGSKYASNLLSLVTIVLGIVSLIGMLFPEAIIYTQSFYNDQQTMGTAVLLFQFFAIQTVFYGASSIFSGLLNANRKYFHSSFAPVVNNIIVIVAFLIYAAVAPHNQELALYVIAIGNPLGVFCQMAIQWPALRRNGIRLRFQLNLKDPYIKETLSLGIPAFMVMLFSFATVSVTNAASYCFADNGPSIIVYARFWYALPYSFFAIPISTSLFTELSHMHENSDDESFVTCTSSGISQILFMLIPFTMYLIVFSFPLVSMYHIGAFTNDNIAQIASYLAVLCLGLPFYGLSTFFQKVFSCMRRMGIYALLSAVASIVQIALTMAVCQMYESTGAFSIEYIALASAIFYIIVDAIAIAYLKWRFGRIGFKSIALSLLKGSVLGALGAIAGFCILQLLQLGFGALDGGVLRSFIYTCIAGCASLLVTFGIAVALKMPEASSIINVVRKVKGRFARSKG